MIFAFLATTVMDSHPGAISRILENVLAGTVEKDCHVSILRQPDRMSSATTRSSHPLALRLDQGVPAGRIDLDVVYDLNHVSFIKNVSLRWT